MDLTKWFSRTPNAKVIDLESDIPRPKYIRTQIYSTTGELINDDVRHVKKNVGGFVISYSDKIVDLLRKCDSPTVIRLFMLLAHKQQYGTIDNQFGWRCTRADLAAFLHVDRRTIFNALDYLQNECLVHEKRLYGCFEYMVNPYYVTIGKNRDIRLREWQRRWQEFPPRRAGAPSERAR